MMICIPVTEDRGLASPVSAHFGSAPAFVLVDTDNGTCRTISNQNQHHAHGMCQPLKALAGHPVDAMVVGGIGRNALLRLGEAGIKVYLAEHPTVDQTLAAYRSGSLRALLVQDACAGHHAPQRSEPAGE